MAVIALASERKAFASSHRTSASKDCRIFSISILLELLCSCSRFVSHSSVLTSGPPRALSSGFSRLWTRASTWRSACCWKAWDCFSASCCMATSLYVSSIALTNACMSSKRASAPPVAEVTATSRKESSRTWTLSAKVRTEGNWDWKVSSSTSTFADSERSSASTREGAPSPRKLSSKACTWAESWFDPESTACSVSSSTSTLAASWAKASCKLRPFSESTACKVSSKTLVMASTWPRRSSSWCRACASSAAKASMDNRVLFSRSPTASKREELSLCSKRCISVSNDQFRDRS
mmetsp:Transcript_51375/g.123184  ORF Transcript_51375/g.123184 Transcript_51375/m.123184 type:complete len:293 (+) Transcript_51375:84-962(+)